MGVNGEYPLIKSFKTWINIKHGLIKLYYWTKKLLNTNRSLKSNTNQIILSSNIKYN